MSDPKRLVVNLFEMNTPGHITHGLWRLPDNNRERYTDIRYWTELDKGGHFAAFEQPESYAHELRSFFGSL